MAEEKKDVYVITDNTEAYEDYENLTLVKLEKQQVNAIKWLLDRFNIDINVESIDKYRCEEP